MQSSMLRITVFISIVCPSLVLGQWWCGPPTDCSGSQDGERFADPADCECYYECVIGDLWHLCCDPLNPCFDHGTLTCTSNCASALCCRGTDPLNVATVQYSYGSLDCSMAGHEDYSWSEYITEPFPQATYIYHETEFVGNPNDQAHYELVFDPQGYPNAPSDYHLDILNALPRHAGKYRCQGRTLGEDNLFAEFIVLEDNVQCMQNDTPNYEYVEWEYAKIACGVLFHGAWGPVMRWSGETNATIPALNGSFSNWAEYYFEQEMTPELDGAIYTCDLYYTEPVDPLPQHATNAPVFTDQCQTVLTVFYTPRNTEVRNGVVVHPGMPIDCYTEANPPPHTYSWSLNGTVYPYEDSSITILEEDWYLVTCCATNDIRGANHTDCDYDRFIIIEDLTEKCPPANCSHKVPVAYNGLSSDVVSPTTCTCQDETTDTTMTVVVVILSALVFFLLIATAALGWLYLSLRNQVVDSAGIDNPNYNVKS